MEVYRGGLAGVLQWTALDHLHIPWLKINFGLVNGFWTFEIPSPAGDFQSDHAEILQKWLQAAWNLMEGHEQKTENPPSLWGNLLEERGIMVRTRLDFPGNWGLGSSSTALALLAKWLSVDARRLYALAQNGSGYDLEVALQNSSILYQLPRQIEGHLFPSMNGTEPIVQRIRYRLPEGGQLWLVDPGGKQISSGEVIRYRNLNQGQRTDCVEEISALSKALAGCSEVPVMMQFLARHDDIMEHLLGQPCLNRVAGSGFPGRLKSLGAWGGDLFLAVSEQPDEAIHWLKSQEGWIIHSFDQIIRCEP
jgi:hypothetical protein